MPSLKFLSVFHHGIWEEPFFSASAYSCRFSSYTQAKASCQIWGHEGIFLLGHAGNDDRVGFLPLSVA